MRKYAYNTHWSTVQDASKPESEFEKAAEADCGNGVDWGITFALKDNVSPALIGPQGLRRITGNSVKTVLLVEDTQKF